MMMKIEINFDPATETAEHALRAALNSICAPTAEAPAQVNTQSAKPAEQPVKPAETEPPFAVSKTDIRAAATALSKKDRDALKAIFAEFNAVKLSDIPEDQYPSFMRKLVAANA